MRATLNLEKGISAVARNGKQPQPTAEVVDVTPEMAAAWLARNEAGRKLRQVHVDKYAADMAAGRWFLSGDALKFDKQGNIRDGQHRAKAVVQSGVTVKMFVVHGLEPEAQLYMDMGVRRTLADQFSVLGHENTAVLSAGARLALAWSSGQLSDRIERVSDVAVREFVTENPDIKDAVDFAVTVRSPIPGSVVCAIVWQLVRAGHDVEAVQEFFRSLAEYRSEGPGDPKYALLRRINRARAVRERIKVTQMVSMVIQAFNAVYTGTELHKIHLVTRKGGYRDIPAIAVPRRNVSE